MNQNLLLDRSAGGEASGSSAAEETVKVTVGQMLTEARAERCGMSLEQISEELCIRPHLLEALERDDFNKFPSACYATGFLKNYAAYLGLNVTRVVSQYREEFNGCAEKVNLVFLEPKRSRDYTQQIFIALVILSILVLYGVWYTVGGNKHLSLAALPDPAEVTSSILAAATRDELQPLRSEKRIDPAPAATGAEPGQIIAMARPEITLEAVKENDNFRLIQEARADPVEARDTTSAVIGEQVRLVARDDAWVRIIDADQDILVDRILLGGEEITTANRDGMTLMTSNAGAVALFVGAVAVESLGKPGEIRENISLDREHLLLKIAGMSH